MKMILQIVKDIFKTSYKICKISVLTMFAELLDIVIIQEQQRVSDVLIKRCNSIE